MNHQIRKAAILVDSLEASLADALLDCLSPQVADSIRSAVLELGDVDAATRQEIVREFMQADSPLQLPNEAAEVEGVELEGSLARIHHGPSDSYRDVEDSGLPFSFLAETDGDRLAELLEGQQPRTIAIVLRHMPPDRAAEFLTHFSEEHQQTY